MPPSWPNYFNSSMTGSPPTPPRWGQSLDTFVGIPGYDLGQLRADLHKFTFLLGATDGKRLFTPDSE
jgi:hypothetical protein